jgi:hypothetical protein
MRPTASWGIESVQEGAHAPQFRGSAAPLQEMRQPLRCLPLKWPKPFEATGVKAMVRVLQAIEAAHLIGVLAPRGHLAHRTKMSK